MREKRDGPAGFGFHVKAWARGGICCSRLAGCRPWRARASCVRVLVRVPRVRAARPIWPVPSKSSELRGHQCLPGLMAEGGVAWHARIPCSWHACARTPLRARVLHFSVRARAFIKPTPAGTQPRRPLRPARETCGLALGRSSCSSVGACVCLWRLWLLCLWVFGRLCVLFVVCGPSPAQTQ